MKTTQNQKAIYKLLTQSTGASLGDSGDDYGRHWQKNQARSIQDFMRDPQVFIELTHYLYDGKAPTEELVQSGFHIKKYHFDPQDYRKSNVEYSYTISIFHWLDKYFDLTNKNNDPFISKFNRLRKGSHKYLEDRQDEYLESIHYKKGRIINSCNDDSNLSQVYKLTPIYSIDSHHQEYCLLSIHQGCDVRGGYTIDIMVKINLDEYPLENVYGNVEYNGDGHPVSNTYDGTTIRFDEHPTEEIDPARITSLFLFLT